MLRLYFKNFCLYCRGVTCYASPFKPVRRNMLRLYFKNLFGSGEGLATSQNAHCILLLCPGTRFRYSALPRYSLGARSIQIPLLLYFW